MANNGWTHKVIEIEEEISQFPSFSQFVKFLTREVKIACNPVTVTVYGVPGTRRRGTSFKHFNSNTEQRSLETGTHTQGMTLRLDTEAGKHRALKGETKLGN